MDVETHAQEWREVHVRDRRHTKGEGKPLRARRKACERKRRTQEESMCIMESRKERDSLPERRKACKTKRNREQSCFPERRKECS